MNNFDDFYIATEKGRKCPHGKRREVAFLQVTKLGSWSMRGEYALMVFAGASSIGLQLAKGKKKEMEKLASRCFGLLKKRSQPVLDSICREIESAVKDV